jgi:hypothetical protein
MFLVIINMPRQALRRRASPLTLLSFPHSYCDVSEARSYFASSTRRLFLSATKICVENLINTSRSLVKVLPLNVHFHSRMQDETKCLTKHCTYGDHNASCGVYETK